MGLLSLCRGMFACLFVGCLTSQQHAGVSQGRICSDNLTCCHTEIQVAGPISHLTQSQCTDTGPTSPSADPITPGALQGSHRSANFEVTGMTRPPEKSGRQREVNPGSSALETDALTARPTRRFLPWERGWCWWQRCFLFSGGTARGDDDLTRVSFPLAPL